MNQDDKFLRRLVHDGNLNLTCSRVFATKDLCSKELVSRVSMLQVPSFNVSEPMKTRFMKIMRILSFESVKLQ